MSHSAPAPIPGMTRRPDSADSDVIVRARTAAGRHAKLVTVTMPVIRSVWPRTNDNTAYASNLSPKYG